MLAPHPDHRKAQGFLFVLFLVSILAIVGRAIDNKSE